MKLTLADIGQRKRQAAALRSAGWSSNGGTGSTASRKTRGWLVDTVTRAFGRGAGDNGASNAAFEVRDGSAVMLSHVRFRMSLMK